MTKQSANTRKHSNLIRNSPRSIAISACFWPSLADTTKRSLICGRHYRWCLTNQQLGNCSTRSKQGARSFVANAGNHGFDYLPVDAALTIDDHLRRGFAHVKSGTHFLDLGSVLGELCC